MNEQKSGLSSGVKIFIVISALVGLAMGLSDSILANYFKEAYAVNAQQRGFIEFPRELPGVLSIFFIAALAFMGNIRSAVIAQLLSAAGIFVLALMRPSFPVMLVFLFIFSAGQHMYIALGDSIGLSLAKKHSVGSVMGRFNGVKMASLMLAGVLTFAGFRVGWFSFETPVTVFLISAAVIAAVAALLLFLRGVDRSPDDSSSAKVKFVFKKEYIRYYIICALFGGRKQIMIVYSPWVLIDLLDFKADTMSMLAVAGSLIGVFFMPVVGKWIDRFGFKKVMTIEALSFILIYVAYGFLSGWINTRAVALSGIVMILVYLLNIIDRMTSQFGMVRAIYMRSIAVAPEDVTPSLSLGMGIDHIIAIAGSYICGAVWFNWGPQYVFIIAGLLSLANLIVARGIKVSGVEAENTQSV